MNKNMNDWSALDEDKKVRNAWVKLGILSSFLFCAALFYIFNISEASVKEREKKKVTQQATYTFMGYGCISDCSGHIAGYDWAQRKGIDDESDCKGRSLSFIEGCVAYVEEMQ